MPLLVVPLGRDETDSLTMGEWDALRACERVLFERPDHPLAHRLRAEGVDAGPFDDEPSADASGWALVTDPGSGRVVELARAGAAVSSGAAPVPDALTAAHGASIARSSASALGAAALVMARLRSPDGCPWDHEQTHESLRVHLLEEAHEVLEAIDAGSVGAELEEELGDLLLQVLFHAQMAADDGRFGIEGVARTLAEKLVRRHPHVFGDVAVGGASDVVRNWEAIKATEGKPAAAEGSGAGLLDGIPRGLPALLAAYKAQKRAARLGWEADAGAARAALESALEPPAEPTEDRIGDALFWTVALARAAGIDPESALRQATHRFAAAL